MRKAHVLLVVLAAAIIPLLVSPGEYNAAPEPPVNNSAGHYELGDGRYLAVIPAVPVPADTVALSPQIDTYFNSGDPGCESSEGFLRVGRSVDEFEMVYYLTSALGFSLASIPSDATVTSATLYAYQYMAGGSTVTVRLYQINSSWDCYSAPSSYTYRSGRSVGSALAWYSWDATSAAQAWVGKAWGSSPNWGLRLAASNSGTYQHWFRSNNATSSRPYLRVVYQLPTATPTPSYTPSRTPTPTRTPTATPTPTPTRGCEYPLVVNSADDADDGACDSEHCSLREAIDCANIHPGPDTISFNIPRDGGFTGSIWMIWPGSELPTLTDNGTTIDATTQTTNQGDTNPDGPEINLIGGHAGAANGLVIASGNNTIRGLAIGSFEGSGVLVRGGGAGNTVADNYIGVAANGVASLGNDRQGVEIVGGASGTTVEENVIGGNHLSGVWIGDTGDETGNVVEDNVIGLRYDQSGAIPNGSGGVTIMHGAHDNTVGPANIISGNGANGVGIGMANGNTVTGNLIGTNGDGTIGVGNERNGVDVADSANTTIEGNIISGNAFVGLKIYGGGGGSVVRGNTIGLNAAGAVAIPNGGEGLIIEDGETSCTVGGATGAERNVISGNGGNGIGIKDPGTRDITILGNYVGTDGAGTGSVPNGGSGIKLFDGVQHVTIGPNNVIAANTADGVHVDGIDTLYNTITQNSITGNGALGIENIHGGNTEIPPPDIRVIEADHAAGFAHLPGGAPCVDCIIEVFSDPWFEGAQYLGSTTTRADGSWALDPFSAPPLYPGRITATSTDTDGNTSEFPGAANFMLMEVEKEPVEPPGRVASSGDEVVFSIRIRNSGATLTEIALSDEYGPMCLEFVDADPDPDTVNEVAGLLVWDDLTTHFGDLGPGEEIVVELRFRALGPCILTINCATVEARAGASPPMVDESCEDLSIQGPPGIDVHKAALDPVVCVGDEARFQTIVANTGSVPVASYVLTDTYDTTYLASTNDPVIWGPDDGELVTGPVWVAWPWLPGMGRAWVLRFLAEAETPSTIDEFRAMVNGDPDTERGDTASVTILPEPGACEGNLVTNWGFEDGLTDWLTAGNARTGSFSHSGTSSLLLGILPDEPDVLSVDAAAQEVTIPPDAHGASLSFWVYVDSLDLDIHHNFFVAGFSVVRTGHSHTLVHAVHSPGWQRVSHDLSPYVGETVGIGFAAYNDGGDTGPLWAYVDDVEICVSRCGPSEPDPGWEPGMCWKASWPDYAPNGVPDFDQDGYETGGEPWWVDGPAAAANSLWWLDSKFEPEATPPPDVSDGHRLVEAYDGWDDHDERNVSYLVEDLGQRMQADGVPDHTGDWIGTRPDDLAAAIRAYLTEKELEDEYTVTLEPQPSFDGVRDRVLRSEDVLLLLGLWEHQPEGWRRLGAHWVTGAGVDCMGERRIGISDPLIDSAEAGYAGAYLPTEDHDYPHASTVHDDAAYLSHDVYEVWEGSGAGGRVSWGLVNYVRRDPETDELYPDPEDLWGANTPSGWDPVQADEYEGGAIQVGVEYIVAVAPLTDTVTLSLVPAFAEVTVGSVFPVDVLAESRSQPVDTIQVYLDFDPTVLQCVDEAGDPVTQTIVISPTMVMQNEVRNISGQVNYAARVPLGETPITGRVRVTRLFFRPISTTTFTELEFCWTTPRVTDVLSGVDSVLGSIGETVVRIGEPATIHGSVALQGRPSPPHESWEIPLTVELLDPLTDVTLQVFSADTDDEGDFVIDMVSPGVCDLRVKGMHTLANRWSDLRLSAGVNDIDMGELREGDADNDNDVDATDASLVNLAFGSTPFSANWDPRADFDEDGTVDGTDMGLLAASFGRSGDVTVGSYSAAPAAETLELERPTALGSAIVSSGEAAITFSPSALTGEMGDVFAVDLILEAGAQPVDTVEAHITFPRGVLQVVDGSGSPAQSVEEGSAFDMVLANTASSMGTIHYAATMLGSSLTGDVTVATIRFKAVAPGVGQWVRFGVWEPKKTDVTYLGQSVLGAWPAAPVTVTGQVALHLPLLFRDY